MLWAFTADAEGKIYEDCVLLGSLFAHDPYILPHLKAVECTFEALNPNYVSEDPVVSGLLGEAVGDAFGVPVEFMSRAEVRKLDLQDMVGRDSHLLFTSRWNRLIPAGAWSDDTSMTIAAMSSIISHFGAIDYDDIMAQFLAWWDKGKYTAIDFQFGLGTNIGDALDRYRQGVPAAKCGGKGLMNNGNGALMRMFPFSMYCIQQDLSLDETLSVIRKAAGITHGHEINALSCFIYTLFLGECVRTRNPQMAYRNAVLFQISYFKQMFSEEAMAAHTVVLTQLEKASFDPDTIPESGYVVDSLTIALYCLLHTGNYEDAVKMAVQFGYDTDTNAAITGSIAGAMYGQSQIPQRWLEPLKKKETLLRMGRQFSRCLSVSHERRNAGKGIPSQTLKP